MRKVLCIDGGGIKGVFPTSFLATVEDSLGTPVAEYFDLIVGTSTGGIIALGLGLGMSAQEICDLYVKMGPEVFASRGRFRRLSGALFAKYSPEPLKGFLTDAFGERRLGEAKTRLVIPSVNFETGEIHLYKTAHHPKLERDFKEKAVDVAMATAAAPTYFPAHDHWSGLPLIDGGVWANNPAGVAAVEATAMLGWSRDEVHLLSLGCTAEPFDAGILRRGGLGWMFWGPKLADVFMTAQSSASLGTALTILAQGNVIRICPIVAKGRFRLDNVKGIRGLKGLGASQARNELPKLRRRFFDQGKAEPFEPCHNL